MLSGRALNSHLENPGILVTEQRRSSEKPQREAVCLNPCSLYASQRVGPWRAVSLSA